MLVEIGRKAGCLCDFADQGIIHCPLNVRSTSEDVVTGELFGKLQLIDPRWWLHEVLNQSLGTTEYRQQVYRGFQIKLWKKQPSFPADLLPWREGRTEVDVEIRWENPATTIFIEMKLGSDVSKTTSRTDGTEEFPSDQLIRNIRIGLHQAGWFREGELFQAKKRRFALLLVSPKAGHPLVERYRNHDELLRSIPKGSELVDLPKTPFIGSASYRGIADILLGYSRFMSVIERKMAIQISEYMELKTAQSRGKRDVSQNETTELKFV